MKKLCLSILAATMLVLSACGTPDAQSAQASAAASSAPASPTASSTTSSAEPAASSAAASTSSAAKSSTTTTTENPELSAALTQYFSDGFGGLGGQYPDAVASWYKNIDSMYVYDMPGGTHSAVIFVTADTTEEQAKYMSIAAKQFDAPALDAITVFDLTNERTLAY